MLFLYRGRCLRLKVKIISGFIYYRWPLSLWLLACMCDCACTGCVHVRARGVCMCVHKVAVIDRTWTTDKITTHEGSSALCCDHYQLPLLPHPTGATSHWCHLPLVPPITGATSHCYHLPLVPPPTGATSNWCHLPLVSPPTGATSHCYHIPLLPPPTAANSHLHCSYCYQLPLTLLPPPTPDSHRCLELITQLEI